MGPLSIVKMTELQNNTVKAESDLRERYDMKMKMQRTM